MRSTAKYLLMGVALVATLVIVLWLLRPRKESVKHFTLVPAEAVAVISLDPGKISANAGADQLQTVNTLLGDFASAKPVLMDLLKELIINFPSSGIDPDQKALVFPGSVSGNPYIVTVLSVKNEHSTRSMIGKVLGKKNKGEKSGSYKIFTADGWLIALSNSVLTIMSTREQIAEEVLKPEFLNLTKLEPAQCFFPSHPRSESLLKGDAELLCWLNLRDLDAIWPALASKSFIREATDSVSDVLLWLSFHNGEVLLDAEFFPENRSEIVKIHGRAAQVERLFNYHRADNLVLALSLAKNDESPFLAPETFPGMSARQLYELIEKNIPMTGSELLSSAIRERLMLSVTHPPVNIGKLVEDVLQNRAEDDNPFARLDPDIRITMIVDPQIFDSLLPGLISKRILVRDGNFYRFVSHLKGIPYLPASATTFYGARVDDVFLVGNKKEIVAAAVNNHKIPGKRFSEVQKREFANHNLAMHIHLDELYSIFGNISGHGEYDTLLDQAEVMHVRVDPARIRVVFSFKDKGRNSLNLLLSHMLSL